MMNGGMLKTMFAIWIGLTTGLAMAQHADDIGLDVPVANGPVVTSGGDYTGPYAGRVFESIMPGAPPLEIDAPGFTSAVGTFPAGAPIRFDFAKQLLFWNGTSLATPADALTVSFGSSKSATIGGGDTAGLPGFIIASADSLGVFHKHVWFSLPDGAAAGLYGVVMTLGPGTGATGFTTSDSFLVTFENGSFANPGAGLDAVVGAAFAPVPEPATWVLAATGVVAAAWRSMRRTRSSRA